MNKNVYIFNCNGIFDLSDVPELYHEVRKITDIECSRYGFVFVKRSGKLSSRSGNAKNIKQNVQKYLDSNDGTSSFNTLELYDKPKDAHYLDLDKRRFGFFVKQWSENIFNIYIVLPYSLDENRIINLWNEVSKRYCANYMVSFTLDATKDAEIYMYGIPMVRGLETPDEYYSTEECKIVYKLHDLRANKTHELGGMFPICITTGDFYADGSAYKYTKTICKGVNLYVM